MQNVADLAGTAALAICESLLLALNDRNILPEKEILGILRDAAAAHAHDPGNDGLNDLHAAVAALINGILTGGNSVRRRWNRALRPQQPVRPSRGRPCTEG